MYTPCGHHFFGFLPPSGGGTERLLLNDADPELVNCYLQIQNNVEGLIGLLDGYEASKEKHHYFKNVYQPSNELERAFRWYYLNRTSYSGIMNPVNCYWGYGPKYSMQPHTWPRHLRRCSKKLQGGEITCEDFQQVIEQAPDDAFLFVDPPYFNADQDKFYTHSFTLEDHFKLAELLREHSPRLNFLLTYDNSPEARKLYGWASRIPEKEWDYTINRTDDQKKNGNGSYPQKPKKKGKRYTGKEIFVLNYGETSERRRVSRVQLPLFLLPANLAEANGGHSRDKQQVFEE